MISHTDPLDGRRHYTYPGTEEQYVSVTTVLSGTEGKPYLVRWSAFVAARFAVTHRRELTRRIERDGVKDAIRWVAEEAKRLREVKADAGSYVHDVQQALCLWADPRNHFGAAIDLPTLPEHLVGAYYDDVPLDEVVGAMVDGFTNYVSDFGVQVEASEMTVFNHGLRIAGTLDGIHVLPGVSVDDCGRLRPGKGLRLLEDTKTGKTLDSTVPEQIVGYRHMDQALMPLGVLVDMPPTDAGAVLHTRPDFHRGYRLRILSPADEAQAWNRLRKAVDLYHGRASVGSRPGRIIRPLTAAGNEPPPFLSDLSGYGAVPTTLRKAGLEDLDDVALAGAAALLATSGIGPKSLETIRRMLADHGLELVDSASKEVA